MSNTQYAPDAARCTGSSAINTIGRCGSSDAAQPRNELHRARPTTGRDARECMHVTVERKNDKSRPGPKVADEGVPLRVREGEKAKR